jgi:hypothetical protein
MLSRVSTIMLQPCEQFGQTDIVRSSSQARALFNESFDNSAPTGQRSMTFPAHGCVRSWPSNLPMTARSPRSLTFKTESCATSSMNRTHRVQRMQRFGVYMTSPPKSSTGLKRLGSR